MTHPLKWYPIHVAKTGKLKTYDGKDIDSFNDFVELVKKTFRKYGIVNGIKSVLFEKLFPLFAISQLPKTMEFWRKRWDKIEVEFKKIMKGKKELSVFEIGCGSGDLLLKGAIYANQNKIKLKGIGIDIDKDAINFAKGYAKNLGFDNIDFFVGDAISGILYLGKNQITFKKFVREKLKGKVDVVLVEGVIEWVRHFQDQILKTIFSLDAKEYLILAASQKAIESRGGKIITSIAKLSGEEVKGFALDELKELFKKHAGKKEVIIEVCGGDWYPEAFYIAHVR